MIRRFLTRVLMVILIGACGYNGWQVHQLQGEVANLRAQVKSPKRATVTAPTVTEPSSWLDRANLHADNARAALSRGDFGTAQRELTRGSDDLRRAARAPEARASETLAQARQTLAALQEQVNRWQRRAFAPEPVHGKSTP